MTDLRRTFKTSGFQENSLIRCVRDRERELRRKHGNEIAKAATQDLKIDRWFLTRFSMDDAYLALCQEFQSLAGGQNAWESQGGRGSPFIAVAAGGNTQRQLKVNAQRVGNADVGQYIACEGPTQSSVFDFWQLVWQEGVERIVSVNFPYEERLYPSFDRSKETAQYWPAVDHQTDMYMPFRVTCTETRIMVSPDVAATSLGEMVYRVSRLRLSYSNPMLGPQNDRDIIHFCFYRWPDGRIPIPWPASQNHAQASVRLIDSIHQEVPPTAAPVLVHCHAGLGRTGVFISIDMALRQLRNHRTVNVRGVVEKVREGRSRAVMNPWQYATIHAVVAQKAMEMGLLPSRIGGHAVGELLEQMWTAIVTEVDRQFNGNCVTFSPEILLI